MKRLTSGVLAFALVHTAHADPCPLATDCASRPPTMFDLTHRWPEIAIETALASVTYNDAATQGTTYVRVERLSFEMPVVPARWYVGAAYDAAIGHDDDGSPRFVPGDPELWGRGVWAATYGLAFGGGLSLIIPTNSYSTSDAAATTAFAAIAVRGWDRALFDPQYATLRPFLDVRLVTGPVTVLYRQGLEIATDFGACTAAQPCVEFRAVGTVYFGVRISRRVSLGADVIEYYRLDPGLADADRPYFAVGAHVDIETRYFNPSMGLMTNIGSPLDAISRIGAPFAAAPASFVGMLFSLDFPIYGPKKPR